jgi:hypothetical protein
MLLTAAQKEADSNRELSAIRLRHTESLRQEVDSARGRARTAEDDVAKKQSIISHNLHQVRPREHSTL